MGRLTTLKPRIAPATPASKGGWADTRRGSRHERGYGWEWEKAREKVLARDAGLCQPCLRRGHVTPGCNEVDHILNKERGGTDDPRNLQTICRGCHQAKTQSESHGRTWDESLPHVTGLDGWPKG